MNSELRYGERLGKGNCHCGTHSFKGWKLAPVKVRYTGNLGYGIEHQDLGFLREELRDLLQRSNLFVINDHNFMRKSVNAMGEYFLDVKVNLLNARMPSSIRYTTLMEVRTGLYINGIFYRAYYSEESISQWEWPVWSYPDPVIHWHNQIRFRRQMETILK